MFLPAHFHSGDFAHFCKRQIHVNRITIESETELPQGKHRELVISYK